MDIQVEFFSNIEDAKVKAAIWDILCDCDGEFLPPLSSRESSYQGTFEIGSISTVKPVTYFNVMIEQHFIVAFDRERNVLGFMTFKHDYSCQELRGVNTNNYITTICVRREFRNNGITKHMYNFIENNLPASYKLPTVTTRTWSTNANHIGILDSIGYKPLAILKDHRGTGIHTIYYGKLLKP